MKFGAAVFYVVAAAGLIQAAAQRGAVKSGGLPIPGATVTATQGPRQIATSTDENGAFVFSDLPGGEWRIEVRMFGFAPAEKTIDGGGPGTPLDFDLKLGSAAAASVPAPAQAAKAAPSQADPAKPAAPAKSQAAATEPQNRRAPSGQQAGRNAGYQRVQLSQTMQTEVQNALNAQPAEPAAEEAAQNANESFLVNGSLSRGLQVPAEQEMFAMMRPGMMGPGGMPGQNPNGDPSQMGPGGQGGPGGGFGGPGMGGPGMGGPGMRGPMGGGFGGRGGFGGPGMRGGQNQGARRNQMNRPGFGMFGNASRRGQNSFRAGASFSLRNSALDAQPFSVNGQKADKPSYAQSRFSLTGGGALRIPKILTDDKTFLFGSYFGTRSRNPFDSTSTLPTALERTGDFSQAAVNGIVNTIYDPTTHQPFPGNVIPQNRIDPGSANLLSLFPLPNQPDAVRNYRLLSSVPSNSDNLSVRVMRSVSRKDRLSGSLAFQRRNGSNLSLYGFTDTSSGQGINTSVGWLRNISSTLINNLNFTFSRNRSTMDPYFAYGTNWAALLGIAGTSQDPVNYGPPNLSFTNFGALSDGSASLVRNQTSAASESLMRLQGKHTFTFGGDFRRLQLNNISQNNARGTYTFTGLATSALDRGGFAVANTGFDFADFLLGLPQASSIRFGNPDTYLRAISYDAYVQDDWRIHPRFSVNLGLRYEFNSPYTEKYGRLANLDVAPWFTGVSVVTPTQAGAYTGAFPAGLVEPDRNNLGPRAGIAWRPFTKHHTVVRAGYGVYYNGSIYGQIASRLAQQPPFAISGTVSTSLARVLTLQNGFAAAPNQNVTNTYAVDRYYKIGYAQTWNAAIQQELPWSLVVEVGYLGTKGTRLDIQSMPNRAAPGSPLTAEQRRQIGNAVGFTFDSANGDSIYHAGQVRLSRRFRRGFSSNAMYTFAKSIDNASTLGGGGAVVAQDNNDLRAERGLSSFDRRHNLSWQWVYSTSARGAGAPARNFGEKLLRDWMISGGLTVSSGTPFTATVLGNRADTGGTGVVGSGRADATGLPVELAGYYFNPAAFTLPASGQFGNAGRNTIPGPTLFGLNMGAGRTIHFGERRSMDLRMDANNVLNHVTITQFGTTLNSITYGLATAAANMRSVTANLRFRF